MKWVSWVFVAFVTVVVFAAPGIAFAQDEAPQDGAPAVETWGNGMGAGLGAGITILGAGFGIGQIAGKAVESMARQPEVAGAIQTAMIISAALMEGVTFFALVVCFVIL